MLSAYDIAIKELTLLSVKDGCLQRKDKDNSYILLVIEDRLIKEVSRKLMLKLIGVENARSYKN